MLIVMGKVLTEITRLSEKDCFYIVERHKTEFTYPLHQHKEYELNFIENGKGVRRIVGDSVEEIGDYELVLIGGENLEHVWEQGNCRSTDIREITIQFPGDIFGNGLLSRNQFASIKRMLARAGHGLSFPLASIMKIYSVLDTIASEQERFIQFLKFLYILYELSVSDDSRVLASSSFAHSVKSTDMVFCRIQLHGECGEIMGPLQISHCLPDCIEAGEFRLTATPACGKRIQVSGIDNVDISFSFCRKTSVEIRFCVIHIPYFDTGGQETVQCFFDFPIRDVRGFRSRKGDSHSQGMNTGICPTCTNHFYRFL